MDTDSDSEEGTAGVAKARPVRKMSRSWTSTKSELKERGGEGPGQGEPAKGDTKAQLSSSSADPGSSSNANTNSRSADNTVIRRKSVNVSCFLSAAPSSDGSLLKNQWPSQSELHLQMEDKCREIERLRTSLAQAEAKMEAVEGRIR